MPRPMSTSSDHIIDAGSFVESDVDLATDDPISFAGYHDALTTARATTGATESVRAGAATIAGHAVEIATFEFAFLGGSMGTVAGERVTRAIERAAERAVPFVLRTATGGARMQEGMRSLVQMPKLVAARKSLADARVPYIAVLGDPTTGGVLASLGAVADYTIAETGATIGFAGPRVVEVVTGEVPSPASHTAASALHNGMVDAIVDHDDVHRHLAAALSVFTADNPTGPSSVEEPEVPSPPDVLDAWASVQAARSPDRPSAVALANGMCEQLVELRGDRAGSNDDAVVAAVGRVRGRRMMLLALDRHHRPGPSGFRKARRCLAIAGRLALPVVTFVDTAGADPSEASEAGGIAWEIAALFDAMLDAPVPIVAVVTGEGGSGGALAFATGDVLIAYENSIFTVIAPEAAAAILWRDSTRAADVAHALKLTANDLKSLGIVDVLLPEPPKSDSLAQAVTYHLDRMKDAAPHVARRSRWRHRGERETSAQEGVPGARGRARGRTAPATHRSDRRRRPRRSRRHRVRVVFGPRPDRPRR